MASLARLISLFNQCFPRTGVILPIGWLDILHAGATRPMELAGVFIEYIIRFRLRRYLLGRLKRGCVYQCTFPSSIVDLYAGLGIVDIGDGGADKKLDKPCLELRMLFLFQRSASA